jgi:hypothetical protein
MQARQLPKYNTGKLERRAITTPAIPAVISKLRMFMSYSFFESGKVQNTYSPKKM